MIHVWEITSKTHVSTSTDYFVEHSTEISNVRSVGNALMIEISLASKFLYTCSNIFRKIEMVLGVQMEKIGECVDDPPLWISC